MTQLPDDFNPTRLLVCGDWHGNLKHAKAAIALAARLEVDAIVHVGDLAWGWVGEHPRTFSQPLEEELTKRGLHMVWVDGNHENHQLLRQLQREQSPTDGFVTTGETGRLLWAPRAHRWEWSGVRFAAMGGAYSIDRSHRREGMSVFADLECVADSDVVALGSDPVDVLLAHEVPAGVWVKKQFQLPFWMEAESDVSRQHLRQAVVNTAPKMTFSGHWHQRVRQETRIENVTVDANVLHMDGSDHNAVLLTLPDLTITEGATLSPGWSDWTRSAEKKEKSARARAAYHAGVRRHHS